jgi:RNA polymerase sigma factor (sigma-70 family)
LRSSTPLSRCRRSACAAEERERERERERETEAEATARLLEFLGEIWKHHLPGLYAHLNEAWGISKGKGAEGIVSAARDRLIDRRPALRCGSINEVMGCLHPAIDSEVVDRWRKLGRRLVACDEQTLEALAEPSASAASAEDLAIEAEDYAQKVRFVRRLLDAIRELPPKLRDVAERRWLGDEEPTFKEIGEHLGINEDAAQKRCERARAHLRRTFGQA